METEQSLAKLKAEKESIDESGHSEIQADLQIDTGILDPQKRNQGAKIAVFTSSKKTEKVLLDTKQE